jgi:hypothetical protein
MEKIDALEAVLRDPSRSQRDKDIARAALDARQASSTDAAVSELVSTAGPHQELSPDSKSMLLALGKGHLREISEDEFAHYTKNFGLSHKQDLCRQWREWVCPDDEILDLIGLTRANYWQIIHDHGLRRTAT